MERQSMKYALQRQQVKVESGHTRLIKVHDDAEIKGIHRLNDNVVEMFVLLPLEPESDISDE